MGAGLILLVLKNLAQIGGGISVIGLVCGGLVVLGGVSVAAKDPADRALGGLVSVAGGLTIAASLPVLSGLGGTLLWIGGIGLLTLGGVRLFRFFRGLRSRR